MSSLSLSSACGHMRPSKLTQNFKNACILTLENPSYKNKKTQNNTLSQTNLHIRQTQMTTSDTKKFNGACNNVKKT